MPKTTARIADLRKEHGAPFVNDCIRRGMAGEPGFFFAIEGPLMVGMPDAKLGMIQQVYDLLQNGFPVDCCVEIAKPKGADA